MEFPSAEMAGRRKILGWIGSLKFGKIIKPVSQTEKIKNKGR